MDHAPIPVLITRAEPGASETCKRVETLGANPILAPMLSIEPSDEVELPDLGSVSDLVFTSANGVRVFSDRLSERDRTAWCVGPATAAAAIEAGFQDVRESTGNAIDLAEFIAAHSAPGDRPLLHVANAAAKGDLKARLSELGFETVFASLYVMRPAAELPSIARDHLTSETPIIVLIHSAKGAERLAALCRTERPLNAHVVAISSAAASALSPFQTTSLQVAEAPNEDGLMAALATTLATLSA